MIKISFKELPNSLWKNGLGLTKQYFIMPDSFTLTDSFDYRISSAQVTSDSSFSLYPNYKRALIIWSGNGLRINHDRVWPLFSVNHFSGNDKIDARLINGPIWDFGIIYNEHSYSINIDELLNGVTKLEKRENTNKYFLFCASGELKIGEYEINSGDLIIMDQSDSAIEISIADNQKLFLLTLLNKLEPQSPHRS
jgi:environmental stress-induced protein Ves